MSALPYFRWYPGDALGDQKYSALSDMELGFYHRCLNVAWLNGGLPPDLNELADTLHVTRKYLDKVWPKVGRCFQLNDCVHPQYVNPRQEKERSYAISKSVKAATSVSQRKDRTINVGPTNVGTNDVPRGRARADTDTDTESKKETKEAKSREVPLPQPVDYGARYRALYDCHVLAGFLQDGEYEYNKLISTAMSPAKTADAIDESHALWTTFFLENPKEYRPGIGKWFKDGYWTRLPKARESAKPVTQLSPAMQRLSAEVNRPCKT